MALHAAALFLSVLFQPVSAEAATVTGFFPTNSATTFSHPITINRYGELSNSDNGKIIISTILGPPDRNSSFTRRIQHEVPTQTSPRP